MSSPLKAVASTAPRLLISCDQPRYPAERILGSVRACDESWGGRPERAKTYGKKREHVLHSHDFGLTRPGNVPLPARGGHLLRAFSACKTHWTHCQSLNWRIARNKQRC